MATTRGHLASFVLVRPPPLPSLGMTAGAQEHELHSTHRVSLAVACLMGADIFMMETSSH